jgi:hypothetical protein
MGESGGSSGRRVIDVRARAGIMIIQQGMRTAGSNLVDVPDNYNIGTSSVTIALGGGILIPKGKYIFGGEMTYEYSKTLGGGVAYDKDKSGPEPGVNIGIVVHNVNVRGMAGIDLKKKSGMALLGRLGYRYQGFLIDNVADMAANPAQLPSEVVIGRRWPLHLAHRVAGRPRNLHHRAPFGLPATFRTWDGFLQSREFRRMGHR